MAAARDATVGGLLGPTGQSALLTDGTHYDDVTRDGFVIVTGVPLSPHQGAVLAGGRTMVLEVEPGSALPPRAGQALGLALSCLLGRRPVNLSRAPRSRWSASAGG